MNLRRDRLVREVRSTIAGGLDLIAELSGKLADRIDPPVPRAELPREESLSRQESRSRHPAYAERPQTLLGDVTPPDGPLAEVVSLPRPGRASTGCVWHPEYRCETPTALCLLDCPRPEEDS